MAKSQKRSNREPKKPKASKKKNAPHVGMVEGALAKSKGGTPAPIAGKK